MYHCSEDGRFWKRNGDAALAHKSADLVWSPGIKQRICRNSGMLRFTDKISFSQKLTVIFSTNFSYILMSLLSAHPLQHTISVPICFVSACTQVYTCEHMWATCVHTHVFTHSHTHSHPLTHTLTYSHPLTHTLTHSHILPLTHTYSLSLSLSHTHTQRQSMAF